MVTSGVSEAARSVPRDDTGPVTETASAQHGLDRQNTLFNTKMQRHRYGGRYTMHHIQRIPTDLQHTIERENSATRLPGENSASLQKHISRPSAGIVW